MGSPASMPRPWHEGHGGYQIESVDGGNQLEGPVVDSAMRTYRPDVILLLAGTNNLNFPDTLDPTKTSGMYDRLLAQIFALSPGVGVVASPVPWKTSVPSDQVAAFNERVQDIVGQYADAGYRITWVGGMTGRHRRRGGEPARRASPLAARLRADGRAVVPGARVGQRPVTPGCSGARASSAESTWAGSVSRMHRW